MIVLFHSQRGKAMGRKYLEDIIPKEEIFGYHDETDERHGR